MDNGRGQLAIYTRNMLQPARAAKGRLQRHRGAAAAAATVQSNGPGTCGTSLAYYSQSLALCASAHNIIEDQLRMSGTVWQSVRDGGKRSIRQASLLEHAVSRDHAV